MHIIVMPWKQRPAVNCLHLAVWKNTQCSLTASWSIRHKLRLLYYISQHITYTWDYYLEPSSMDLHSQDSTGDTFVLRNGQILSDLLREHRPHWTEGQEFGILLPNEIRAFDNPKQPYMMRLSCHEALSNPNMPP